MQITKIACFANTRSYSHFSGTNCFANIIIVSHYQQGRLLSPCSVMDDYTQNLIWFMDFLENERRETCYDAEWNQKSKQYLIQSYYLKFSKMRISSPGSRHGSSWRSPASTQTCLRRTYVVSGTDTSSETSSFHWIPGAIRNEDKENSSITGLQEDFIEWEDQPALPGRVEP